jgi:hypothetical protein
MTDRTDRRCERIHADSVKRFTGPILRGAAAINAAARAENAAYGFFHSALKS